MTDTKSFSPAVIIREFNVSALIQETEHSFHIYTPDKQCSWTIPKNNHIGNFPRDNGWWDHNGWVKGSGDIVNALEDIACKSEEEATE